MKGKIVHLTILWLFLLSVGGVVLFEVFNLPDQQVQIKGDINDLAELQLSYMANQISVLNYYLTFIGIAGAIAGVAFTIFGYYQSTKFPEMVEKKVNEAMRGFMDFESKNNKEMFKTLVQIIHQKEFEILDNTIPSILFTEADRLRQLVRWNKPFYKLNHERKCQLIHNAAGRLARKYHNDKRITRLVIHHSKQIIYNLISINTEKGFRSIKEINSAETKLHITKKYIELIDKIPELIENEPTLWKNEEPYIHEFANKKEED